MAEKTEFRLVRNVLQLYGSLDKALDMNPTAKHLYENRLTDEEREALKKEDPLKIGRYYFSKSLKTHVQYTGIRTYNGIRYYEFFEYGNALKYWLDPEDVSPLD